jgi:5-methylcytosine-specific restriction endonuclease McrA
MVEKVERVDVVSAACTLLGEGDAAGATTLLAERYPFEQIETVSRDYSAADALRVFQRDGFIDRYSGGRLLFPGVLRVLSAQLPAAFPYHPNWKMSETHFAYWELFPTVDHVRPLTRGGVEQFDNLVTTSMLRNSAKAACWDGLQSWFLKHVERTPRLLENRAIRGWHQAALGA